MFTGLSTCFPAALYYPYDTKVLDSLIGEYVVEYPDPSEQLKPSFDDASRSVVIEAIGGALLITLASDADFGLHAPEFSQPIPSPYLRKMRVDFLSIITDIERNNPTHAEFQLPTEKTAERFQKLAAMMLSDAVAK